MSDYRIKIDETELYTLALDYLIDSGRGNIFNGLDVNGVCVTLCDFIKYVNDSEQNKI